MKFLIALYLTLMAGNAFSTSGHLINTWQAANGKLWKDFSGNLTSLHLFVNCSESGEVEVGYGQRTACTSSEIISRYEHRDEEGNILKSYTKTITPNCAQEEFYCQRTYHWDSLKPLLSCHERAEDADAACAEFNVENPPSREIF